MIRATDSSVTSVLFYCLNSNNIIAIIICAESFMWPQFWLTHPLEIYKVKLFAETV